MNRFKSRKFWLAVGTVFSIAIAELTGYDVDPAAIAGVVFVISTYIVGQGIVDKSVGTAQVMGALDVGKAQLEAYARNLEQELAKLADELEVEKAVNARDFPLAAAPPELTEE
ncbi:hypothetical protein LCGC14_2111730 [marine sediment metagenome]|uniref:Uncharacterized protein n=1 Tax=marine sediment metagenome TaxID=412755 RepID=A0A0F9E714_9ZZZZ